MFDISIEYINIAVAAVICFASILVLQALNAKKDEKD